MAEKMEVEIESIELRDASSTKAEPPTYLDGTPVPQSEIDDVRERLQRGELAIEFDPEELEALKAKGISMEEIESALRDSIGVKKQ